MPERHPIVTNSQANVSLVQYPVSVKELVPTYRYQVQDRTVPPEAQDMYSSYIAFLNANSELVETDTFTTREDYVEGFRRAVATFRLWIDTMYLEDMH